MTKNLEYYLQLPYRIVLQPDPSGGYVASIPDLPGCISQGDTREEAIAMIEDAKAAWISSALEQGLPVPEPALEEEYSGKLLVRMPRSLHRTLAEQARMEGVSLNQLILYHLSRSLGIQQQPGV
jgi:antitoxin HicB